MNGFRPALLVLAMALSAATLPGQAEEKAAPLTPERFETIKLDADDAYNARRYKEAFGMFHDALAKHGDAYGQYMTGIMLREGLGTKKDVPMGTAWMMLAGEQGNLTILEAANIAAAKLSPGDERLANLALRELRHEYSNCALLRELVDELDNHVTNRNTPTAPASRYMVVYGEKGGDVDQALLEKRLRLQRRVYQRHCVR
ncbi:MAG: SEL1-like repeat protein [Pseudomonadota bacterium]